MESSPWGSLLVRAVAQGLLNTEEGCPLTDRYALKEALLLRELARTDEVTLQQTRATVNASGSQVLYGSGGPLWKLFQHAQDCALNNVNRMGRLMRPWDDSIKEEIKKTDKRIYDRGNEIGDTGMSDRVLVQQIKDYEALKQRKERELAEKKKEPVNESSGSS